MLSADKPGGVYFLRADDTGRVRACGPQKVLASRIETVAANTQKILLPLGFGVRTDDAGKRATARIDTILQASFGNVADPGPRHGVLAADIAAEILDQIKRSLDFSGTDAWDAKGHATLLKYLATHMRPGATSEVSITVTRGGTQPRVRPDGRLQNYFTFQRDVAAARAQLNRKPGLHLVRQNPGAGFPNQPFWWPMLLIPDGIPPHVFALS